ncbi:hypothetical protein [Pseudarthrobacter oxydans]|uniref:hypothetical protein n=1 Tax=Pseudarthrobacter oxydans TaxID=1671 RepID=UPI0035ECFE61|nr:hypothetical protein GCM10017547_04680 [Pseudarthrobacter oxydans]
MTISVGELFDECGLRSAGVVQWGDQIELDVPGIYIVASTPDLDDPAGQVNNYRPNFEAFDALRSVCPRVTVDGVPATSEKLAERIGAFWIAQSATLYVGLAGTSVRKRVNQYYSTGIGQRSPHAGGWWLKTLVGLESLFVHYAKAQTPRLAEARLLETFAAAVPPSARRAIHDSERIAPFANVEVQAGLRKRHGMAGYKKEPARSKTPLIPTPGAEFTPAPDRAPARPASPSQVGSSIGTRIESQVITDKDRASSNLRIPARSKFALPAVDGYLEVSYQDQIIEARWRVNGSRSGTIGLGKTIMRSIGLPNSSIWMRVDGSSVIIED